MVPVLIQVSARNRRIGSDGGMFEQAADRTRAPGGAAPVEIDLRALQAPEPMLRALEAADGLAPGESVCVLTPLFPPPLLDALTARGLRHEVEPHPAHGFRVLILHPRERGTPRD